VIETPHGQLEFGELYDIPFFPKSGGEYRLGSASSRRVRHAFPKATSG
jgi:hypothetical protein